MKFQCYSVMIRNHMESLYLRALENILNQYFPAVAGEWRGTLFGWQEIQKCARTQGVLTPQGHTLGPTSAISVTPRILLWKFDDLSNCKGSTPTWLPPSENFRRSAKHGQHDAIWQSSKFTSCGQDLLGSLAVKVSFLELVATAGQSG